MALSKKEHDLVVDCISIYENKRDQMSQFEIDFISGKGDQGQYDSLIEKYEKYGEDVKLSEKQLGVLERMYDKIILGIKPEYRGR